MKIVLGRDDLAAVAVGAGKDAGAAAERVEVKPVNKASRAFMNDNAYDVCEIPLVTLLQAAAYDKPVSLLPVTTLGRFQHQTLVTLGEQGVERVKGSTVGQRSWSQTTGVWLRGFLTEQYGIALSDVEWRTYEDGHVDEYTDPSWVKRAPEGVKLQAEFLAGEVAYGIMGNELPDDDRIRTAIPDALDAAEKWASAKGFAPVNHVVGVSVESAKQNAKQILAVYDALAEAAAAKGPAPAPVDLNPVGFAALRGPFTAAANYAFEQEVLPRRVEFDELVERTCAALGVTASRLGA